ncbi:MAG: hypothetical protein AAGI17_05920 [Planctomycetota bacterium]
MRFTLVDRVIEKSPTRVVAIKCVSLAEEYLQDHFPSFPVLPGVMMLEAMIGAARELAGEPKLVLGTVRGLKYGQFLTPGSTARIEIERKDPDSLAFTGKVILTGDTEATAAAGKFELRAIRGCRAGTDVGTGAGTGAGGS